MGQTGVRNYEARTTGQGYRLALIQTWDRQQSDSWARLQTCLDTNMGQTGVSDNETRTTGQGYIQTCLDTNIEQTVESKTMTQEQLGKVTDLP